MAEILTCTVVESYGGTYITLKDTTASPTITIGSVATLVINDRNTPTPNVYTCTLDTTTAPKVAEVIAGIKLYPDDFSLTSGSGTNLLSGVSVFPDGVFDIVYTVEHDTAPTKTVGWGAVVTEAVVKDSLGYSPDWDYVTKDVTNEKVRLLRNLSFSLEIGDIQSFQINLEELDKLVNHE
jgi:hypothetical protein